MNFKGQQTFFIALLTCGNIATIMSKEQAKFCPNNDLLKTCQCFSYEDRQDNYRELQCDGINSDELYRDFSKILTSEAFYSIQIRKSDLSSIDGLPAERVSSSLDTLRFDDANIESDKISKLIEGLDKLKHLLIDNNRKQLSLTRETFSEDVPLEILDLNSNSITNDDIAANAFENIRPSLKVLRLRDNQLTRLPAAIHGLPNLEVLDLAGNAINVEDPTFMETLKSLPQLNSINVDKIDCSCLTFANSPFVSFIRERQMVGVVCSEPQQFAGKHVMQIDPEKDCTEKGSLKDDDGGPDGSGYLSLSIYALLTTLLLTAFK